MTGATQTQHSKNRFTGLVMGAIALSFFLAVVLKYYWLNG